ncbi:MAG TPA: methyltransferase domain-containing protein, partial [Byssovorax sp.]
IARQIWLLIRVDMVDDEDLRLFRDARCGLGFGLESGDPRMLATARKAGRLETYLDRMRHVAGKARELDVPWGANVIVGHPGETEESMRTSAAFMREIFLDPRGTTGFLSIDPFRFYPGSPIDAERAAYEASTGARFHRPAWWHDGDPEFLSEWVDPSHELDYRRRGALERELFGPIVREIPRHFVHRGPAVDYFERAIVDQIALQGPDRHLHDAERYYAWKSYLGQGKRGGAERDVDVELAAVCREVRARALPGACDPGVRDALDVIPRERFVPLTEIAASVRDEAIPLDGSGLATVSAMHAYALTYALADVGVGARVLDLGAGTGYGAALLARLVGPSGRVHAVEIDPKLARRAAVLLAPSVHVEVVVGDALAPVADAGGFDRVVFGFAIAALPTWLEALGEGAVVVAPIAQGGEQHLTRFVRGSIGWSSTRHDRVIYVPARTSAPVEGPAPTPEPARRWLPLAR